MLVIRSGPKLGLRLSNASSKYGPTNRHDIWRRPIYRSLKLYSTQQPIHPLRILFCGSDEFSVFSLRALAQLPSSLVESIHVVSRGPKRTGRAPIHDAAQSLSLPIHHIDTFTKWHPPRPIDLIVAVSFGLLIPPRILSLSRFGGVNIHPSFLPDLHGPAPIHWALLYSDSHTGVTLQTLHPTAFDRGSIIAQTPLPGISLASHTLPTAIDALGRAGAEVLTQSIEQGTFARPGAPQPMDVTARHAPKLTRYDTRLDRAWTAPHLLRRAAVLGPLWDEVVHAALTGRVKRVQYAEWTAVEADVLDGARALAVAGGPEAFVAGRALVFRGSDGGCVAPGRVKVEGETWRDTAALMGRMVM